MTYSPTEQPTVLTHDFYLARTLLDTEPIVADLTAACPESQIVSFDGLLVLPLMPRRKLTDVMDPIGKLIEVLQEIQALHPREETISVTSATKEVVKHYTASSSLQLPFEKRTPKSTIHDEAACARRILDPPHRKGMHLVLRALETKSVTEFQRAKDVLSTHFSDGDARLFTVSPPKICAVQKKL